MDEIRKSFHQQLDDIKTDVIELAAMVVESIPRATQALLDSDLTAAQAVIDYDDVLDAKSLEIEEECQRVLALQQPMASDLRVIMTAIRLNWDLERAGDLACNICKTIRRMYGTPIEPKLRGLIVQMSDEAYRLTRLAIDAYAERDVALAAALDDMDDRLDALQRDFVIALIEQHDRSIMPLQSAVQLALIARYYERLGDHAVNIGERIQYMVTGWLPEHTGAARAAVRRKTAESFTSPDNGA
ncbi:MAG TPA: phosphate signaling complex protein PhoU [Acidimicrobiales bacterium]|nr:phosphate signaling complex protein PhoU [Acidimicrobiales bacterium]